MPVNQRGGSWQASVTNKGQRYRRNFATKVEAERWEADAKVALARGDVPDLGDSKAGARIVTLKHAYDYTCEHHWFNKTKSLAMNGRAVLNVLGESTHIARITTCDVDACIKEWYAKGNTGATVNRKLSALHTMLDVAKKRGTVFTMPHFSWQEEGEHRIRYFSEEEEQQILQFFEHVGKHMYVDMVILAVDTGLRMGTLRALRVEHLDIADVGETSWIRLPGSVMKAKNEHHVPMTARAREAAIRRIKYANREDGRLFPVTKDAVDHHWTTMRRHLGKMQDAGFIFHTLRHTYCSRLVQRGVSIEVIQKLAGHKHITVTQRYAKLCPKNLSDAVSVLERAVPHDTGVWHGGAMA